MKAGIHPQFYPNAQVICACGNTWNVGATVPVLRTDICSKCHPFFTGEQRIADASGQVDRFIKKLERRSDAIAEEERRKALATSPELPITELGLAPQAQAVLAGAGIKTVGDVLARLEAGDETLTNLKGFGLKSLAMLKKQLRARGFILPGDQAETEKAGTAED